MHLNHFFITRDIGKHGANMTVAFLPCWQRNAARAAKTEKILRV